MPERETATHTEISEEQGRIVRVNGPIVDARGMPRTGVLEVVEVGELRLVGEVIRFREDVTTMDDLEEGMELEGVVTNVTAFGAFVDIGVHQDGLVHISQLADHFVEDPHREVQVGQKLKVRVLSVDSQRGRIGLSARSETGQRRSRRR